MTVFQLAQRTDDPTSWRLTGGLMVQLHATTSRAYCGLPLRYALFVVMFHMFHDAVNVKPTIPLKRWNFAILRYRIMGSLPHYVKVTAP